MKKLVYVLIASFIGFSGNCQKGQIIGVEKDGKYVITESIENLRKNFMDFLSKGKVDANLDNFEILSGVDKEANDETYYFLRATDKEKNIEVSAILSFEKSNFRLAAGIGSGDDDYSTHVSCTGCRYGCHIERHRHEWYCSDGCGFECSKTESN